MDRPSHVFADSNSLWAFYNYVTIALQHSHPRTWMEDQRILHYFISTVGNFTPVAVIAPVEEAVVDELENNYGQPENQTNLLVQIAEITGDESLLAAQYPVTEEEAFKLSDTQVVQEEIEIEPVVHQSEEMILDANEAEEDHVIIDDEIWTTEEEPLKIATILDETIKYTDPVGNTFEAPVVPCVGHDTETEKDLEEEIRETEVKNFLEEVAPEVDFSLAHDDESIDQMVADYEMMEAIESSEGTPIEANLDNVPVEKKEEIIDNSFDLDFVSDDTEESGDDIPDFF
jgi:hypothetical protein